MILAHRCVALFGPSGAGKSSVMQAAVIPELDEAYDFRHVTIDGWPTGEEPVAWLLYTLHAQLKLAQPDGALGLYESVEWTVRQAFRRSDRPILIYLDQIEQLLFTHRDVAGVDAFFDWLDRFAEQPIRGLHLVLAMREDYLGRFRERAAAATACSRTGFASGR
jgi:ABC-type dipeptide/oligopeptide/nickel transport system ATPase subunit